MSERKIAVTSNKTQRTVEFEKNFGDTLEEAKDLFGEEVVFSNYLSQVVIRCQGSVRGVLNNPEKGEEDALAAATSYKPGVARVSTGGQSAMNKVLEAVAAGKLTDDQVREFLQKLQASKAEETEDEYDEDDE